MKKLQNFSHRSALGTKPDAIWGFNTEFLNGKESLRTMGVFFAIKLEKQLALDKETAS